MRARFPVLLLLASACGSSGPSAPLDIAGTWTFGSSATNATLQVSCNQTGTVTITQNGSQFSGSYASTLTCTGPGVNTTTTPSGAISSGTVSGRHVAFNDDAGCQYAGAVAGLPTNVMSGSVDCNIALLGTSYPFSGTWTGTR